ncbi:MAG TPA: TonB-dependent receptor [Candidatus Acidoferrum sp.]|nr:TonB-dependent receptor [Candidatus Acidoferrum sp.]
MRSGDTTGSWRWGIAIALAACLSISAATGKQSQGPSGNVEIKVVVKDSEGNISFVPSARLLLSGQIVLSAETDELGKYEFVAVPAGSYAIQAEAPGLEGAKTVLVQAGKTEEIQVELKPTEVKSSVTVTANEQDKAQPSASASVDEKTLRDAPNVNERFESALPLLPGVVRGPDGRINLKGARATQSGALVNSANVTDPATGNPAINVPIDVVSSVQVISNPYDPQYGKLAGAVSTVETKTGNYDKFHFSAQNLLVRPRVRGGSIEGIGAATPRISFSGPLVKNRIAITQAIEYRYVRTPVNSLPASQRDTKLESFDSYTQLDAIISAKQTATMSLAIYPQKLDHFGLNTFTPQPATPDFHQRGYQVYLQHRYLTGEESILTSQFSFKKFDADVTAQSDELYRLLPDTTEGGFFSRQARRTSRVEWQENYQFSPFHLFGSHVFKAGLNYSHSSYDGRQRFLPAVIGDASGNDVERITFTRPTFFESDQSETAWYAGDQWTLNPRLIFSLGLRFDSDTITTSTHASPRAGFLLSLTSDSKTLLKGGVGIFYDRVPLMIPVFGELPNRSVTLFDPAGRQLSSISYVNRITEGLRNPRSTSWNLELDRQILAGLLLRVAYEQRNTSNDFVVSPFATSAGSGVLSLSNGGSDSYKEFQVTTRYQIRRHVVNASYVRSKAFGDLNDFNQFFGTLAQPVIQPNEKGRPPFDVPNRFLLWGTIAAPWKLTLTPVYDLHTGFPYSVEDEFREYVGPRNVRRYPRFSSFDLQVSRPLTIRLGSKHFKARAGMGVFNLFNHFNPRDVQANLASAEFGGFYNNAWREFRGKFVLEF